VSESDDQLALFGAAEAVVVRRSTRARKLALRVFPHGVVEVVAPLRTGQRTIDQFVLSNAGWIARTRGRFRALVGDAGFAPPVEIALAAIGERWDVAYAPGKPRLRVQAAPGGGRLSLAGPDDPQWRRQRLRSWLMARARATLVPWLTDVSAEVGLAYAGATVRRQRSRWGSCTARKTISLNCALLFLEPTLVRHLFLHELAHTRHLDHSPAFWRLVATLDPDFQAREQELRGAWHGVPAWVSYDEPE
jgi:predicted metal-dependent hydrolase